MLWIALHLPRLSFESWLALLPPEQREQPAALMDARDVILANDAAQRLDVLPGLRRSTALALAPQLHLGQIDAARDGQALTSVTHVALAFTPAVCLADHHRHHHRSMSMSMSMSMSTATSPGGRTGRTLRGMPDTVLLQVQASLRCFGGWQAFLRRLRAALTPLEYTIQLASAPTAQGAAMLARLVDGPTGELHCADLASLEHRLDAAPLRWLGSAREHGDVFESMGLCTIGALRRLPRQGLARRFGAALLDEIDAMLGRRNMVQPAWITLPDAFDAHIELQSRADTTDQVLHGARLLIEPLLAWARAHQSRVRRFTLLMHHEPRHRQKAEVPSVSELSIALAEPSCDAVHLSVLLRERLAHLSLPAPTLELRLCCADVVSGSPISAELFASRRSERAGLVCLIERLQARLGPDQVQHLAPTLAVHPRRNCVPERLIAQAEAAPRPVWLLHEPQPLPERQSRPMLNGQPLQLLCGPERVESGWWNNALATQRDYFIAQTPDGALLWVYRARLPLSVAEDVQGWFVSGWFA